eukprot:gb/GFBE01006163.1/.p1 GENE.gb/GFBE01006163.1/~~gb/GFBE01006163.1/.p1  ORF type:complete len:217 (+),score=49.39 gb/GFBE01006163.1/:1-651(+)
MDAAETAKRARLDDRLAETTTGVDPDCKGPLDCSGSRCHDECEARHLDPVERMRFDKEAGFRYPKQPTLVVTASRDMGRTASTWVFNAVRLLFRQGREACDSYWMRQLTQEKLERRMSTGAHVLVKTHEWTSEISEADFEKLLPMFSSVVVSVRQGFPPDPDWMKAATHVIHFEDIVAHDDAGKKIGREAFCETWRITLGSGVSRTVTSSKLTTSS